jgi:hypothetical protein
MMHRWCRISARAGVLPAVVAVVLATHPPVAAGEGAPAAAQGAAPRAAVAPAAAAAVAPGTYTGRGFDACTAPSSAAMQAWLASPYRAVGVYIGGVNRACTQPNLTAAWVSTQQAAGWHLVPIYLGLQPTCTLSNKRFFIDPANAAAQGTAAANDAVAQAQALGLGAGSTVFYDMEAYRTDDAACRTGVLKFIGAWNARLHDLGYLGGFYGSLASSVADQVAVYTSTAYVRPDYLWFARYDNVATVSNPAIPSTYWTPHRRLKQYVGGHDETWGGVTINIDNDYLDVAPIPRTAFGDFNRNGWSDLIARYTPTGRLYYYPGNGTAFGSPAVSGPGWNSMDAITRLGDFNRDGYEDLIAREKATGYLWLYRGNGASVGNRLRVGTGWNSMREITAIGDVNRDGYNDLLAVQTSTGYLFLYPGRGTSFGPRVRFGPGWNAMDELTGVGDFNRDGYVDLFARAKSTGDLFLYPGRAGGFGTRTRIGTGWKGMRSLTGVGDFDRDGYPDLFTVQTSTGYLFLYRGRGTSLAGGVMLRSGWGPLQPLF